MSFIVNTNDFAVNFLPPKKRLPKYMAWVKTLVYPLQYLYSTMFGTYKDGNSAAEFDVLFAYSVGQQVKYSFGIYQCWVATTAGILPTDSNYWYLVQSTFVGIEPRTKYNSQRLVMEWLLNEYFGTTFVNTPGASDIYVDTLFETDTTFWVGLDITESSLVVKTNVDITGWVQEEDLDLLAYNFAIYVPIAIWTALGTTTDNRNGVIRNIANNYVLAGIKYEIITY